MKTAIYLRVSTQEQNFDSQRHEIGVMVKARGLVIDKEYTDKESGAKADREGLMQLLKDAKRGLFNTLIIYKLDRLGRSLKQVLSNLEELTHYGVSVISIKESIDMTSPQGKLMVHLISAFSEFERSLIVERVRSGLRAAKAKGVRLGAPLVATSDVVLRIRQLRTLGMSIRKIAEKVNVSKSLVHRSLLDS